MIEDEEFLVLEIQTLGWVAFDWQCLDYLLDIELYVYKGLTKIAYLKSVICFLQIKTKYGFVRHPTSTGKPGRQQWLAVAKEEISYYEGKVWRMGVVHNSIIYHKIRWAICILKTWHRLLFIHCKIDCCQLDSYECQTLTTKRVKNVVLENFLYWPANSPESYSTYIGFCWKSHSKIKSSYDYSSANRYSSRNMEQYTTRNHP